MERGGGGARGPNVLLSVPFLVPAHFSWLPPFCIFYIAKYYALLHNIFPLPTTWKIQLFLDVPLFPWLVNFLPFFLSSSCTHPPDINAKVSSYNQESICPIILSCYNTLLKYKCITRRVPLHLVIHHLSKETGIFVCRFKWYSSFHWKVSWKDGNIFYSSRNDWKLLYHLSKPCSLSPEAFPSDNFGFHDNCQKLPKFWQVFLEVMQLLNAWSSYSPTLKFLSCTLRVLLQPVVSFSFTKWKQNILRRIRVNKFLNSVLLQLSHLHRLKSTSSTKCFFFGGGGGR